MSTRQFIGEIVGQDGFICLRTAPGVWYPLAGNSGLAVDFVEAFGEAKSHDIGKHVYRVRGVLQMENDEQKAERESA